MLSPFPVLCRCSSQLRKASGGAGTGSAVQTFPDESNVLRGVGRYGMAKIKLADLSAHASSLFRTRPAPLTPRQSPPGTAAWGTASAITEPASDGGLHPWGKNASTSHPWQRFSHLVSTQLTRAARLSTSTGARPASRLVLEQFTKGAAGLWRLALSSCLSRSRAYSRGVYLSLSPLASETRRSALLPLKCF